MPKRRIKKSFTGGELDPLMGARLDFTKYKNGSKKLYNMVALASGSATRRPGSKFIYDLTAGPHPPNTTLNVGQLMIPVVISATVSALLVMYTAADGKVYVAAFVNDAVHYSVISDATTGIDPDNFTYYNIDYAQYGYLVYIAQPNQAPFYIHGAADATSWTPHLIAFEDQPVEWGHNNWPETVTFHQQRSVWGCNQSWPQRIWASQTQFPHKMGDVTAGTVAADSGYSFNLESNNWDKIVWMKSDMALNVGTLGHEWVVTGLGGSGPISPAVDALGTSSSIQTSIGSKDLKPVSISGALNFVGKYGSNIYEFQYQFSYDKYMASDKSILAGHLTKTDKIRAWTYQRTPNGILWSATHNGNLLGCTTIPEHKVTAWHHHHVGDSCIDVCAVPSDLKKQDLLYMIVLREVDGVDHTMVERLSSIWTDPQEPQPWEPDPTAYSIDYYVDSYKYFGSPGQTVTGLEHLAGREVAIWADGATHLPQTVTGSGEVTLNYDGYEHVVIGLPFISEARPYLQDVESDAGSAFGQMQRVTALDIDFYKTIGGEIGVSYQEEDGTETEVVEDLQFRTNASSMSTTIPRYTGIYHTSFLEGSDRKTEYFIRQRHPQPMTIRGIVDTVEVE